MNWNIISQELLITAIEKLETLLVLAQPWSRAPKLMNANTFSFV